MRKKVKKVIKGLEKASKTHAKQAKILKSGLKVFKARGGRDMGAGSSGMGAGKSSSNMIYVADSLGSLQGKKLTKLFKTFRKFRNIYI